MLTISLTLQKGFLKHKMADTKVSLTRNNYCTHRFSPEWESVQNKELKIELSNVLTIKEASIVYNKGLKMIMIMMMARRK